MPIRNKISFLQATSNISRGDPIFRDSDKPYLCVDKAGRPIGFRLKPEDVRLTYIDWYIHKLAQQTIHSPFMIFDMASYIKRIYHNHTYEDVIKSCLLLQSWSNVIYYTGQWDSLKNIIDRDIRDRGFDKVIRKWYRQRTVNKLKIWRWL